jgi:glycosyltransferase involved in cell wall biosynthesis
MLRSNAESLAYQEEGASLFDAAKQAKDGNDIRWVRPDESMQTARALATLFDFSPAQREASLQLQAANPGSLDIRSVNWFIPEFTNAGYGGIHTILRLASHLRFHHGIVNRFYYLGTRPAESLRASIVQCFPGLEDQVVRPVTSDADLEQLEYADASVATLWTTAYAVLKFQRTRRKFYMLQDYEPLFYPAGTTSAQVEATYRFGFYGLANTQPLREIYEREHGGLACSFTPAVETALFYPAARPLPLPWRVFFYGRPNNPRNAFELGTEALRRVKEHLGKKVQIIAAGEYWRPEDFGLEGVLENQGVLSIRQTAELYRTCDLGLALMFTRHPSYLPLEFMASRCLVVTNRNNATTWLLRDKENCLLSEPSVESLADTIERGLSDASLRERVTHTAHAEIHAKYADWTSQLDKLVDFMRDPHAAASPTIVREAA